MRTLLLLMLLTMSAVAQDTERPKDITAPDHRHLVRLYPGWATGNCKYDRAELIEVKSAKVLHQFEPAAGFENDSVVWSPGSTHVAVYTHSHRWGLPLVIRLGDGGITTCAVPEIKLPHEGKPENSARQSQSWLQPTKWLSESVLLISDAGLLQQQRGVDAFLSYDYAVQINFDSAGIGTVKSIKCVEFDRDKSWLTLDEIAARERSEKQEPNRR